MKYIVTLTGGPYHNKSVCLARNFNTAVLHFDKWYGYYKQRVWVDVTE